MAWHGIAWSSIACLGRQQSAGGGRASLTRRERTPKLPGLRLGFFLHFFFLFFLFACTSFCRVISLINSTSNYLLLSPPPQPGFSRDRRSQCFVSERLISSREFMLLYHHSDSWCRACVKAVQNSTRASVLAAVARGEGCWDEKDKVH